MLSAVGEARGLRPAPLETFKHTPSAVSRLYNWNLLTPVLAAFGIPLEPDTKALIVAGGAPPTARPRQPAHAPARRRPGWEGGAAANDESVVQS